MKKTMKLVVFVLCVALGAALVSCASSGGGGGKGKTPAGTGIPATGEYVTFDDHEEPNNGNSVATITSAEESVDGETMTVYTIKGNVTTQYIYGFAGWGIVPDEVTLERIKKATGISFKVLGDGKRYAVKFKTKECESDYCYYEYGFNTEPGQWATIEVPIKFFQQPSWGQWKKFNQESFTGMEWQTHENWRKSPTDNPFEVKFADLRIFND